MATRAPRPAVAGTVGGFAGDSILGTARIVSAPARGKTETAVGCRSERNRGPLSQPPAWEWLPRSKFSTPGFSTETVRSLHGAWKALRKRALFWRKRAEEGPGDLERPDDLPSDLVPEIDIEAAAASLGDLLASEEESGRKGLRIVTGPPGTSVARVLGALGQTQGWAEIEAPDRRELLGGADALESRLEKLREASDASRFLPRLESWFLRRERALPGLRALLRLLANGSGAKVVGCDSWTWAYLDRILGIEGALGEPLALAPFDGAALDGWLGEPFRSRGLVCLRGGTRNEIFCAEDGGSSRNRSALDELASAARGNPGAALALWRRSLRAGDLEADEEERAAAEDRHSWWAVPPDDAEPDFPAETDDLDRFVLHACLVHGGLDLELACEGLPFPDHEVVRRFDRLISAGVLAEHPLGYSVSEAAYIPVRRSLAGRGFSVDAF